MPTIKDVLPYVEEVARTIRSMNGVEAVYVTGSVMSQAETPDYAVKDIDIIVKTTFDSGDLMAIDAGSDSPLKMNMKDLEDFGFNPEAVKFTKAYLAINKHNLDHWATSRDGKLLHWGTMPESVDDWQETHEAAEKYAEKTTGYNRLKLGKQTDDIRRTWQEAYHHSVKKQMGRQSKNVGWCPSDNPADEIIQAAKLIS